MSRRSPAPALAAAALLVVACWAPGRPLPPAPADPPRHLRVLHLNDVAEVAGSTAGGGLARAASVVRAARGGLPRVLVTGGGDLLAPSAQSLLLDGAPAAAAWRALGLSAAVPGDRDLALGAASLARRVQEAGGRWSAANLARGGELCCGIDGPVLLDVGGLRVGVAGIVGEDAARQSGAFRLGLDVTSPLAAAREAVARLRAEGAEVVLLLAHGERGLLELLARAARPDVVLGGHEGTPLLVRAAGVPVVRATLGARDVVQVDLWVGAGRVAGADVRFLPVDSAVAPDARLEGLAAEVEAALAQAGARPAGSTTVFLDGRLETVGSQEAPLGNLLADLGRQGSGADAALIDAGSLAPLVVEPGPLRADLPLRLFPDLAPLPVLETSGADLLATLEHAVSRYPTPSTRFLQVSGIRLAFAPDAPPGTRLRRVEIGGAPIVPMRRYRVAVTSRLAAGADGHARLRAARRVVPADAARLMAELLLERQRAGAPLAPEVDGRLAATPP